MNWCAYTFDADLVEMHRDTSSRDGPSLFLQLALPSFLRIPWIALPPKASKSHDLLVTGLLPIPS
jgi:hypothetical protein